MSTEPDLPSELMSFEAQLRRQSLPACRVDRDELMYEAGWAAAEASRQKNWLWPATSVVLAASVLALAAFLVRGPEEPRTIVAAEVATPQTEKKTSVPPVASDPPRYPLRWIPRSPFLAMRDRALRMEFDEPVSFVEPLSFVEIDDDYAPKALTARELMQEFLEETS